MAVKFIADVMLGKLVRWLRALGFDTVYDPRLEDARLLQRAHAESRILLTRDTRLAQRRLAKECVLIHSDHWQDQVRQVVEMFGLPTADTSDPSRGGVWSRCVTCNSVLEPVDKSEVRYMVPAHIYDTHATFKRCATCRRVYWRGSHCEFAESLLNDLFSPAARRCAI